MIDAVVDLSNILRVNDLTKRYGRDVGIEDVSFTVEAGEIVGLLGPNGSGKSTTLHCLTGILSATSGTVEIAGVDHELPAAKDGFGFLPDDLPLPESLRSLEVMALHRRLRARFDRDLAEDLLELVGLTDHRDKYVGHYSHGMKRKLQLVIALAHRPRLLIMDEPMRGLDPEAAIITQKRQKDHEPSQKEDRNPHSKATNSCSIKKKDVYIERKRKNNM